MPFDRLGIERRTLGRSKPDVIGFRWAVKQFLPDSTAEWGRLGQYLIVAFALGCAAYFSAGADWWLGIATIVVIVALALCWTRRHSVRALMACSLIGAFALGAAFADIRTRIAMTPVAKDVVAPGEIRGRILSVEPLQEGTERVFIRVAESARLGPTPLPFVARLTAPEPTGLRPGVEASFRAVLFPPPKSSVPNGYDPQFWSYFQGVSAHGRLLSPPVMMDTRGGALTTFAASIRDLRLTISERVGVVLPDPNAGFANALLTGLRGGLDRDARDALRIAGLGHVLAISGLHMAIIAGGVFWTMRRLLVAVSLTGYAVRPKQTAALIAIAVATGYLLISGAAIASQRAFIMIVIMFLAVLCGRRALTLRNVAIAAAIVLALQPAAVMSAGFQMSFAATIALIAGYRRIYDADFGSISGHSDALQHPMVRVAIRFVVGLALTALLAGLATGPIAAFHFNRTTPYGLVANVLAMPIVTFVVMPFGLLSILFMPFGLESIPLGVMDFGLDAVLAIANMVTSWPVSDHIIRALSPSGILFLAMAALALAIMARPPPGLVAVGLIASALSLALHRPADISVNESASLVAVRMSDDDLGFLKERGSNFVKEIWLRRSGARLPVDQAEAGIGCDRSGCAVEWDRETGKIWITTNHHRAHLLEDCRRASIIVADYWVRDDLRRACTRIANDSEFLLIDKNTLSRQGATEIILDQSGPSLRTVRNTDRLRPWQKRPALKGPQTNSS